MTLADDEMNGLKTWSKIIFGLLLIAMPILAWKSYSGWWLIGYGLVLLGSLQGLFEAKKTEQVSMIAVLDNEEVGSSTKQGADSDFLKETVYRICKEFGLDEIEYRRVMASSFMVSADNAHAAHPNAMEKADATNRPFMNEGIVIKYNGNQKEAKIL